MRIRTAVIIRKVCCFSMSLWAMTSESLTVLAADGSFYYSKSSPLALIERMTRPHDLRRTACGQDFKVRIYDTSVPPTSCITKSSADSSTSLPGSQSQAAEPEMPGARFASRRQQMRSMFSNDQSVLKEIKTVQGRSHFSRWTITVGSYLHHQRLIGLR